MQFREVIGQHVDLNRPYSCEQVQYLLRALSMFIQHLQQGCVRSFQAFELMVAGEVVSEVAAVLQAWGLTEDREHMNGSLVTSVASWGLYGAVHDWVLSSQSGSIESFNERVLTLVAPIVETVLDSIISTDNALFL